MLVYGDPQFTARSSSLLGELIRRAIAASGSPSPDLLRAVLIQAGQFEQGWADLGPQDSSFPPDDLLQIQAITDAAADAFLDGGCPAVVPARRADAVRRLTDSLVRRRSAADFPLTVKIPEGFEFYTLYPEQYALAGRRWTRSHRPVAGKVVLVVGLRSIGTTLSAVVGAALRGEGWTVRRITTRP